MNATLITGADGHVGRALAHRLLQHSEDALLLFVRAADDREQQTKRQKLGALAANSRCRIVFGDLREPAPFASIGPERITGILHCGAVTNFTVAQSVAAEVNVLGTEKALDFAARCPRLRRFGFVSTIYAAGLCDGPVDESPFGEPRGCANFYEWSKRQAENRVLQRTDLPGCIYRLATIVAEDGTGTVVQHNALHNTLRLLYYGLLSVLPGKPGTRIYTVTTSSAARALVSLFMRDDARGIYHLSDAGRDALTLGELMDLAYETFLADPAFARRQILRPLFCDHDSFVSLVEGSSRFGGILSQSLQSVAPFARQLYSDKDVQTSRMERVLGRQSHDPRRLAAAVARFLLRTRWGLETPAVSREAAR